MNKLIFILLATIFLSSCQSEPAGVLSLAKDSAAQAVEGSTSASASISAKPMQEEEKAPGASSIPVSGSQVMIIRTADVQFQVADLQKSHDRIEALVKSNGSYFASDNHSAAAGQADASMVIRVPASAFDQLMGELMQESVYTNYRNIRAEDVSEQFVDVQARLKTKKEAEQRYLAILRDAKKVSDVLEVESQLRQIREEIESAEGRLKWLSSQVGYSTINLQIYQKLDYTPEPETGFTSDVLEAFVRGWRNLIHFFVAIIRLWPFLLIIGIVFAVLVRKASKK